MITLSAWSTFYFKDYAILHQELVESLDYDERRTRKDSEDDGVASLERGGDQQP